MLVYPYNHAGVVLLVIGLASCIYAERPICRPATNCEEGISTTNEFFYKVNGGQVRVEFLDVKYFVICCDCNEENKPVAIDDPSLPSMRRLVTVDKLIIRNCLPPGQPGGSYASALAALNVSTIQLLDLHLQSTEPSLTRAHFTGLPITALRIFSINPLLPGDSFLAGLHKLRGLILEHVVLSPTELKALPTSLEYLKVINAQLSSAVWLERLLSLKNLMLGELDTVGRNFTFPPLAALPNMTEMSLFRIKLEKLEGIFNESALKTLRLDSCGLTTLPSNMFEGVNLTSLSLARNNLSDLPNGLFFPLRSLIALDLSDNMLTASALQRTLPVLQNLLVLKANWNPLGSLCGGATTAGGETSRLPLSLKSLQLRRTNATHVCADWVQKAESLTSIDLASNNIEVLVYTDLMMKRRNRSEVTIDLRGNLNLEVRMSGVDLDQCRREVLAPGLRAPVVLRFRELMCDCRHAWFRAALRDCGELLSVSEGLRCRLPNSSEALSVPAHRTLLEYDPDHCV